MSKPGTLTTVVNLSKFSFGSYFRRFVCGLILLGAVFARADYPQNKTASIPLKWRLSSTRWNNRDRKCWNENLGSDLRAWFIENQRFYHHSTAPTV